MRIDRRWWWTVVLPLALILAALVVRATYARRVVRSELGDDLHGPLQVAQVEIEGWRDRQSLRAQLAGRSFSADTFAVDDRTFRHLDATRRGRGSRVSILVRDGDSVRVLAYASRDDIPLLSRARAWSGLPPHIRTAFDSLRTSGTADEGWSGDRVLYATLGFPDLHWVVLRELSGDTLVERMLVPLGTDVLIVSALILLALGFGISRHRLSAMRREQELAELRGDFVAAVSHELRTPLAQIKLFATLLKKGAMRTEAERDRAFNVIEKEAERLAILVDNVLSHTRLRRGASAEEDQARSATTDVNRDVEHAVDAFAPLAVERGARIVTSLPDAPVVAAVDSQALRQIVLNFLENAVKYGPRGQTVRIDVTGSATQVRVAVSDEGPGVLEAERETIWAPFQRGDAARSSGAEGSGIGLSVVRDLAVRYRGTVDVERPSTGGARFAVVFAAVERSGVRSSARPL